MLEFNELLYKENIQKVWATHTEVEKIADTLSSQKFENIFFIAIGGSQATIAGIQEMLKTRTTIPTYVESASEVVINSHKLLTKKSLVITISKSGDTKEIICAVEYLKKREIKTVAIVCNPSSPLAKLTDHVIVNPMLKGAEAMYLILLFLTLRLLHNNKEFDQYEKFIIQTKILPDNFTKAKTKFDPIALDFTNKYKDTSYQLWIGSGNCWYEVYSFAMCILEEMQWMVTKSVTSSEFFHGTLEIVEQNTCVILVKGLDKTRILDTRVEQFVPKISNNFTVIDLEDYIFDGIDRELYNLLAPALMSCICTERLASYLSRERNHSLDLRRYYRQLDY